MKSALIRSSLLAASMAYALTLSTEEGRRWAQRQTWATVVVGCALTLLFLSLENKRAAQLAAEFFAISGAPMITRSLWLQIREREQFLAHTAVD